MASGSYPSDQYEGEMCKRTFKKILVLFGSFVNVVGRVPRDIDIIQIGMTEEEIKGIIYDKFMVTPEDFPFDIHNASIYAKEIKIPIPGNSNMTKYEVLHYEYVYPSNDGKDKPPRIDIVRCDGNIPSILRDETKSIQDIIDYLSNDSNFGWIGIAMNIMEIDRSDLTEPLTLRSDYVNGRISLVNAVEKHIGIESFKKICDGLWWGKLLYKIYEQKPTNLKGLEYIKKCSPSALGPDGTLFYVKNNPKSISCTHGFYEEGDQAVDKYIGALYGDLTFD